MCVQRRVGVQSALFRLHQLRADSGRQCDKTRPTCLNCRRANRPCPGYGPDIKFQDEGPRLRSLYAAQEEDADVEVEEEAEALSSVRASPRSSSSSSPSSQGLPAPFEYLAGGALPTLSSTKTPTPPLRRDDQAPKGNFEMTALVAFMSPTGKSL